MSINTPVPTWSQDAKQDEIMLEVRKAFSDLTSSINESNEDIFGSNQYGYYLKYKNGVLEQWGTTPVIASSTNGVLVSFPIQFFKVPIIKSLIGTDVRSASAEPNNTAPTITVYSFMLAHGYGTSQSIMWSAIGTWY
jgi:hypothetical protein